MKRGNLIALLFLIVVISGCSQFQGNDQPQTSGAFVGGTKGLTMKFAQGEPPISVLDFQQETFFITLLLKNEGEFTIPANGLVATLSGISKEAFSLPSLSKKNSFEISGAKKDGEFITQGVEESLEFGEASYKYNVPADFSTTMRADVCYTYQTNALSNLCLKKNVLRKDIEDVCNVNVPTLQIQNSGAPIQLNTGRESAVGTNKIKVSFKIVNAAGGAVYEPGTFVNDCAGREENKDKVKITLSSIGNKFTVRCTQLGNTNMGVVKLVNKQKDLTCTIDTTGLQETTFQDLMIFKADYMYREGVVTPILIRNAEG